MDAIEMADDNYTYFLDLETGESVFLADELITGLDNERLDDEIEENPERYLKLPRAWVRVCGGEYVKMRFAVESVLG